MGRYVIEKKTDEIIWKYIYGKQHSEQYRIFTDYGIGQYIDGGACDFLILKKSDIEELEKILEKTKNSDIQFNMMINSYINFMKNNLCIEEFCFEGDI